jgi:hypothetical protein
MVAYTQSLDQLKQNYGSPIFETFKVSSSVGVKVKLRADGVISDMLILPISPDTLVESRKLTFTAEEARGVLDKLVPASKRGRLIGGGFVNALCPDNDCGGSDDDYENLNVFYNSASIVGRLCYIAVHFKK